LLVQQYSHDYTRLLTSDLVDLPSQICTGSEIRRYNWRNKIITHRFLRNSSDNALQSPEWSRKLTFYPDATLETSRKTLMQFLSFGSTFKGYVPSYSYDMHKSYPATSCSQCGNQISNSVTSKPIPCDKQSCVTSHIKCSGSCLSREIRKSIYVADLMISFLYAAASSQRLDLTLSPYPSEVGIFLSSFL
jgi:hypothetical protein